MTDRKHSHYYKPCPYSEIDFYRVAEIFEVTDPCVQHAIKKLLVLGGRGMKDAAHDVQDVIDSMTRWQEMRHEEAHPVEPRAIAGEAWNTWDGRFDKPADLAWTDRVVVQLRDPDCPIGGKPAVVADLIWVHKGRQDADIIAWRRDLGV